MPIGLLHASRISVAVSVPCPHKVAPAGGVAGGTSAGGGGAPASASASFGGGASFVASRPASFSGPWFADASSFDDDESWCEDASSCVTVPSMSPVGSLDEEGLEPDVHATNVAIATLRP